MYLLAGLDLVNAHFESRIQHERAKHIRQPAEKIIRSRRTPHVERFGSDGGSQAVRQ
jgi:hypothetical protein